MRSSRPLTKQRWWKYAAEALRVLLIAVLLSLAAPLCSSLTEANFTAYALTAQNKAKPIVTAPASPKVIHATVVAAHLPLPASPQTATPACQRPGAVPPVASAASSAAGLHLLTTPPVLYDIYGNSSAQIRQQLLTCTPAGSGFSASTDFWIGSRYRYTSTSDGSCQLSDISVTLRIRQIFPRWQSSSSAPLPLNTQWQAYSSHLRTHENGHTTLNQQYAREAYKALTSLPSQPCTSIDRVVERIMNQTTTEMNVINDRYDAQTNHGATQGAIWP